MSRNRRADQLHLPERSKMNRQTNSRETLHIIEGFNSVVHRRKGSKQHLAEERSVSIWYSLGRQ